MNSKKPKGWGFFCTNAKVHAMTKMLYKCANNLSPYSVYCSKKFYTFNQVSNNESEQRNFTHLIRCQTKSEY